MRVLFTDIAFQSQHCDVSVLVDEPQIHRIGSFFGTKISRSVVAGHQKAEGVAAALAGEFGGHVGIDNCASVHALDWRPKNIDAFKKERAFLFKENREALVCGNHGLVGFDLGKVGIER